MDEEKTNKEVEKPLSTYERLVERKAKNFCEKRLNRICGELVNPPFIQYLVQQKIERGLSGPWENFGDSPIIQSDVFDYEINLLLRTLGIRNQQGGVLEVENVRQQAKLIDGDETKRRLEFYDEENRVKFVVNFFSPKSDFSFGTYLHSLTVEDLEKINEAFNNDLAVGWLNTTAEILRRGKEKSLIIPRSLDKERNYFFTRLGLKESEGRLHTLFDGVDVEVKLDGDSWVIDFCMDKNKLEGRNREEQFLYSQTARDLIDTTEKCGVKWSDLMIHIMSEGDIIESSRFNPRYGNAYSEMWRYVAEGLEQEGIRSRSRKDIFFNNISKDKLEQLVGLIETKQLNTASKVLLVGILNVIMKNEAEDEGFDRLRTNLGVYGNGACEDAEFYLISELMDRETEEDENFLFFYGHRTSGGGLYHDFEMAMTKTPIVIAGQEFPVGFFVRVSADKRKIQPIRLSMFGLEKQDAKDAFGSQFEKFRKQWRGDEDRAFNIGRMLLDI